MSQGVADRRLTSEYCATEKGTACPHTDKKASCPLVQDRIPHPCWKKTRNTAGTHAPPSVKLVSKNIGKASICQTTETVKSFEQCCVGYSGETQAVDLNHSKLASLATHSACLCASEFYASHSNWGQGVKTKVLSSNTNNIQQNNTMSCQSSALSVERWRAKRNYKLALSPLKCNTGNPKPEPWQKHLKDAGCTVTNWVIWLLISDDCTNFCALMWVQVSWRHFGSKDSKQKNCHTQEIRSELNIRDHQPDEIMKRGEIRQSVCHKNHWGAISTTQCDRSWDSLIVSH